MKQLIILVLILAFGQVAMGQKVISAYSGFTAQDILNRAEIPLPSQMTISGENVNCINLTTTQIKTVLGESVTGVGALCSSPKVNKWSGFSSREWYIDGLILKDRVKTPFRMGDFAGYNHEAGQTSISTQTEIIHINSGQSSNIGVICILDIGEVNWSAVPGISKIAFQSKIGSSLLGVTYYDLNANILDLQNVFTLTNTQNQTITSELYFVNSDNTKIADIPLIPSFTTSLIINVAAVVGEVMLYDSMINPSIFLTVNSSSVDQSNETYSLNIGGIYDESIPGYIVRTCSLYAQLNNGEMVNCSKSISFNGTNDAQVVNGVLPFGIDYNDVVYFELK